MMSTRDEMGDASEFKSELVDMCGLRTLKERRGGHNGQLRFSNDLTKPQEAKTRSLTNSFELILLISFIFSSLSCFQLSMSVWSSARFKS